MTDQPTVTVSLAEALACSFRDFHALGVDYLCLARDPGGTTRKVYFFDRAAPSGQVVSPHDHRYPFTTRVLAGELRNWRYTQGTGPRARPFEEFAWRTPLNGGDGFTWTGVSMLARGPAELYQAGSVHSHAAAELHTIGIESDRTVIELLQGPDVVGAEPTRTFRPGGQLEPPSLSGLYNAMDADRLHVLLDTWSALTGTKVELVE